MEVEMDVIGVHHQELSSQTLESMLQVCTKPEADKKPRPPEESLKCPRCDSGNTKFCYYNNYSLTQPRYFCKSCRRYWTKGGTLRNVPVGGGCRKNKRASSTSSVTSSVTSSPSKIRGPQDHNIIHQHPLNLITNNCSNNPLLAGVPQLPYDTTCTDLSLAFARLQNQTNGSMGYNHFDHNNHHLGSNETNVDHLGFLDSLRSGFLEPTTNPSHRFNHNILYNGDMGNVGNLMSLNNHDQEQHQQILNHNHNHNMFNDHQEQETTILPIPQVKQEACNNMMRSSEVGLWGFPSNMIHEVESGRSMIGTNWYGLINSPLM